jgi:dTDP-4-dehydrorhamnose 3,5-epimerase
VIFRETDVADVFVVDVECREDARGFFARTWSREAFEDRGLEADLSQISISYNHRRHTLRGMHFQRTPYEEAKLVRCTMGRIFDVAVDLRPQSPTFRSWSGIELSAADRRGLYVPKGCAHGFLTLEDESEVLYLISASHVPEAASGVRWDDPAFGVEWPTAPAVISPRDAEYEDFSFDG